MNQIITSLLENDMYKFSMGQCIHNQFPSDMVRWEFRFRNREMLRKRPFTRDMLLEIREQVKAYCDLRFTEEELQYLKSIPWIKPAYVDFLRLWHPNYNEIFICDGGYGNPPEIVCMGSWLNTSMYEVPILAIFNEVYLGMQGNRYSDGDVEKMCADVISQFSNSDLTFSEFGLRRRFSKSVQDYMVNRLAYSCKTFVGTSNVHLARKYALRPVGTMAHEFVMCVGQGHPELNPSYSNKFMMEAWEREYGVDNGIALTDTLGTDLFLLDFTKPHATLFSGVRHDSGDPILWGNKMLSHYKKLNIDPKTKTLLFSDSLNYESARNINFHFKDHAKVAFGIGTYLANPTPDKTNVVMKVTNCNGLPVAKMSDVDGKCMCKDEEYLSYLQRSINWRKEHQCYA